MAYINIRKRVRYMLEKGLLQTIEIDDTTGVRGRKDYRLFSEGLITMMPNTASLQKVGVRTLVDYMAKTYHDKQIGLGYFLMAKFLDISVLLEEYANYISQPELMPLKRALTKDLEGADLKEVTKLLYRSESFTKFIKESTSEPLLESMKAVMELKTGRKKK